jgi:hypothetical protein
VISIICRFVGRNIREFSRRNGRRNSRRASSLTMSRRRNCDAAITCKSRKRKTLPVEGGALNVRTVTPVAKLVQQLVSSTNDRSDQPSNKGTIPHGFCPSLLSSSFWARRVRSRSFPLPPSLTRGGLGRPETNAPVGVSPSA